MYNSLMIMLVKELRKLDKLENINDEVEKESVVCQFL